MNRTSAGRIVLLMGMMIGLSCLAGCGPAPQAPQAEAPPVETAAPSVAGPAALAVLAKADGVDGSADHVVSRCPGCNLGMEGSAAHAVQVGEYALHFCSDGCRTEFTKNLDESILAMKLPAPDESTPSN